MKLNNKEIKLTKLEKNIFIKIFNFTDGFGETPNEIVDYLLKSGYNAQVIGGVMSSLIQKDVIWHQGDAIYINPDLEVSIEEVEDE